MALKYKPKGYLKFQVAFSQMISHRGLGSKITQYSDKLLK